MIETVAFIAWAIVLVGGVAFWDRRQSMTRRHAHRARWWER